MKRQDRRAVFPEGAAQSSGASEPRRTAAGEDDPESQLGLWNRLAARVRSGDPAAAADFSAAYRRGVRLLFRRYLGPIGIDGLVDEAVAGAIDELRRGWINEPHDMVHFLREIIARHQEVRQPGAGRLEPVVGAVQSVTEKLEQRKLAALIESALRQFTAEERAALGRYYLNGEPLAVVLEAAGLTVTDFERLKSRLCRVTSQTGGRIDLKLVKMTAAGGST